MLGKYWHARIQTWGVANQVFSPVRTFSQFSIYLSSLWALFWNQCLQPTSNLVHMGPFARLLIPSNDHQRWQTIHFDGWGTSWGGASSIVHAVPDGEGRIQESERVGQYAQRPRSLMLGGRP